MNQTAFDREITCKQIDLSNKLRELWNEHVLWTRSFIESTAFDLPDLQAVTDRLLQNPCDFAKLFCRFYGEAKAQQLKKLLKDHLLIAAELVNALKERNVIKADKIRCKWYENAEDIAKFLASINPYWGKLQWRCLLFDHLRMTEYEAVFILRGQYRKGVTIYDEIQNQAMKMADVMTQGLIRQFNI